MCEAKLMESADPQISDLAEIVQRARRLYTAQLAGTPSSLHWWTAVVVTASSRQQADRYESEIHRRLANGRIPPNTRYLVVPDLGDRRMGSGGATLNALRELAASVLFGAGDPPRPIDLTEWWSRQRVLLIHCGGDSRRLPQYSLCGKLFSAVPVTAPWGEVSTVFDEMLALSTAWVGRLDSGLVVGSGDVILTFDAESLNWERPGVSGVAMLQPAGTGMRHGVYVMDEQGRVYAFLQKPSLSGLTAAGGLLEHGQVALDTGLLRFSPEAAASLMRLSGVSEAGGKPVLVKSVLQEAMERDGEPPVIDLYEHVTMALTGQWKPLASDKPELHALADALKGMPFWCSVVSGNFIHIGSTALFRRLMIGETEFSRLYAVRRQLGAAGLPGVRSAGVVIDSVLSGGGELGADTVVIECHLNGLVRAERGSVLHGLEGISGPVEVPEDTVVHQLPVAMPDGERRVVIRVYGVEDDPKAPVARGEATWFGRPMLDELRALDMPADQVWPGLPPQEWTLWNAQLFPATTVAEAWACARWMQRLSTDYSASRWSALGRLSLASSTQMADGAALEAARVWRLNANWRVSALALVESGADIRPLLANSPGTGPLAQVGDDLSLRAGHLEEAAPTEAASRYYTAGLFFTQAGLAREAGEAQSAAFRMVEKSVEMSVSSDDRQPIGVWKHGEVVVQAPVRIDLGGGWSDTPPFCFDWGGTVLNIAVLMNNGSPVRTTIRRLREPVVRCVSLEDGAEAEYRTCADILRPPSPGDPLSIPRTALKMTGLFHERDPLAGILDRMGGGIEIETGVDLPIGSGLGTSSVLAATILRALDEMMGDTSNHQALSRRVMRLEQLMTTGGGWQDQAGAIFPGAKLVATGPGLSQRLRVQPVSWSDHRAAEFERILILYYTGIRRVARGLLRQVVGRYLARETTCVQVLHSIKTLAMEMAYAIEEGDWDHLGSLLDRHWRLNQLLDPNTTNAPISALLDSVRPLVRGAKLAGAGGGGFLMLLANGPEAAEELRKRLRGDQAGSGGAVYDWRIAREGLHVTARPER